MGLRQAGDIHMIFKKTADSDRLAYSVLTFHAITAYTSSRAVSLNRPWAITLARDHSLFTSVGIVLLYSDCIIIACITWLGIPRALRADLFTIKSFGDRVIDAFPAVTRIFETMKLLLLLKAKKRKLKQKKEDKKKIKRNKRKN